MGFCYFAEFVVGQQTNVGALLVLRAVSDTSLALATRVRGKCTNFYVVACAGECAISLGLIKGVGLLQFALNLDNGASCLFVLVNTLLS